MNLQFHTSTYNNFFEGSVKLNKNQGFKGLALIFSMFTVSHKDLKFKILSSEVC